MLTILGDVEACLLCCSAAGLVGLTEAAVGPALGCFAAERVVGSMASGVSSSPLLED